MMLANNLNKNAKPNWSDGLQQIPSAIMVSMDSNAMSGDRQDLNGPFKVNEKFQKAVCTMPDILSNDFISLPLATVDSADNFSKSFLLIDGKEQLQVRSGDEFAQRLGCGDGDSRVKVVSVIGNTGVGKSYTMNHAFFGGKEVFKTSAEQDPCTLGVWAAFDPTSKTIILDTEGLLGQTSRSKQRNRLLIKVLAVSDVVVYRTTTDRLQNDMFTFLGWASKAFTKHFSASLAADNLGPALVIFHETRRFAPLKSCGINSAEEVLRSRFQVNGLDIKGFPSVRYVGVQTIEPQTPFGTLQEALTSELANTTIRSPRQPHFVFSALKSLNEKFSGELAEDANVFPEEYFTCPSVCLSCNSRCQLSMGHLANSQPHASSHMCRYQHQFENTVYMCKMCYVNGRADVVVEPKYTSASTKNSWFGLAKCAWSGYIIECPNCGEIYRSWKYWYGNPPPDASAVRTEITHVWPGVVGPASGGNSAQRVLEGVSYVTEVIAAAPPTRLLSSWVADQVAPKYWKPNHLVKACAVCSKELNGDKSKHHCRVCGEGVCEKCSSRTRPVPERGWDYPVRVCDACFAPSNPQGSESDYNPDDSNEVMARKVSEAVVTTLTSVASILDYPKSVIKDTARPTYWVPDREALWCCVCSRSLAETGVHHCRNCGGGVCPRCSTSRLPVPHRGWPTPTRVCDKCASTPGGTLAPSQ